MEVIREYNDEDWERIRAIYDLSKPDEMRGVVSEDAIVPLADDEDMLRYFRQSQVWVFEKEGGVVAFAGRKGNVISWLFVHPDHRRQGIARRLLTMLLEVSEHPLHLNLVKTNAAAMSLYESFGFEVVREFEGNMYGASIPAVRMTLDVET